MKEILQFIVGDRSYNYVLTYSHVKCFRTLDKVESLKKCHGKKGKMLFENNEVCVSEVQKKIVHCFSL